MTNVPVQMYIISINQYVGSGQQSIELHVWLVLCVCVPYYRAGTDELVQSDNVSAHEGLINFQVTNLPPGEYEIKLVGVARAKDTVAMSIPSPLATFRVEANESVPVIIIGAVSGAVGVLILIVIGILGGAFFLCFYSHR